MVPPTSHKVSRVSWYFGYCLSLFVFPYGAFTLSGRLSQYRSGNSEYNLLQSLTLQCTHRSLGSFPFARRYSGNRCFFLFLRVLRCFSSPGAPLVSCGTLVSASRFNFSDTGLLPSLEVLSRTLLLDFLVRSADPQPHPTVVGWFGLLRFRSPLLTKSMFLSFPPGT